MGGEALVDSEGTNDKTYVVPIYVTAQIQDRWTLENTAAKRLQKIVIESLQIV